MIVARQRKDEPNTEEKISNCVALKVAFIFWLPTKWEWEHFCGSTRLF